MSCEKCGSTAITHYRQRRADGVWVVTARCENNHSPIKGRPFYPVAQFNLMALPVLPGQENLQPELFPVTAKTPRENTPQTLIELVESKRRGNDMFPFLKRN